MRRASARAWVWLVSSLCFGPAADAQKTPTPGFQVAQPPQLKEVHVFLNLTVQGPGWVNNSVQQDPQYPGYPPGRELWLYANPNANGQFDRWEGPSCAGQGPTCRFTLTTTVAVTCVFQPKSVTVKHRVTVKVEGDMSSATVTSHPAG